MNRPNVRQADRDALEDLGLIVGVDRIQDDEALVDEALMPS